MKRMYDAYRLVIEGGNIKVGPKGQEVSAAPFSVTAKNRGERRADIHQALGSIHDAFHAEHGEHLFGQNQQHLRSGHAFTGSTHDLMGHHVSHEEFAKYKPTVGDVDVQVHHDHKEKLGSTLAAGRRFGKYTVAGTKKHGNEISAVMKHDNGEHHQFDFQGVHHPGSESERFLHSSNWQDTKAGIKGAHHKMLINAAGGEKHKFSITHGLKSRTDTADTGVTHPTEISHRLFGREADHSQIHSFHGVTQLIKKHIPKEQHQAIYNKFKEAESKNKGIDFKPALEHLRTHLNVKDNVNEECLMESTADQHAHVSFLGASPITHMGHHHDIGGSMNSAPKGKKFIGLSGKSDVFSDKEREDIANKQSGGKIEFKTEKSPGQTIARAYGSMKGSGKKVLHLHFGHDRKPFAEGLKKSIENGKIPELQGHTPDEVHIHYPEGEERSHGLSGTKMRTAASSSDLGEFKKHVGPAFSDKEAKKIMDRTRVGLMAGKIKVKR